MVDVGQDEGPEALWAKAKIENVIRNVKFRRQFQEIVEAAREQFFDGRAIAAGAQRGSVFYTDAALVARHQVRLQEDVVEALEKAWKAVSGACGSSVLTRQMYTTMCRKLYLATRIDDGEAFIDSGDFLKTLDDDWMDDSQGKRVLTKEGFYRCWFQLVDTHTDSVSSGEYTSWITGTVDQVTQLSEDGTHATSYTECPCGELGRTP